MLDVDLLGRITTVPAHDRFPGVDDLLTAFTRLAADHPDRATWQRIGTSRLGEPIGALSVGSGPLHAVVVGGVHPNEPIGFVTATHLAEQLLANPGWADSTGYTWHIVPCIDPDGTRLNEAWFAGPFTREHYSRRFYRPAPDEQVEWTFPFAHKRAWFDRVIPETLALMRLIDRTRPALLCTLHNAESGGVYYYLSRPAPELYPTLQAIPAALGLALDTGEPEAPFITSLARGVYATINSAEAYDWVESLGMDPTADGHGDSSAAYAEGYGTLSMVAELPYWLDAGADDDRPSARAYADVLIERADRIGATAQLLLDVLATATPDLRVDSPFLRATRAFAPGLARGAEQDRARAADPSAARPATAAEGSSSADVVHMFRLRFGGMLLRALDSELAVGHGTPVLREQEARLAAAYDGWVAEATAGPPPQPIPIATLVGVQYGALLATAAHARAHPGTTA